MVATGWPVLVSLSNKDFVGETLDLPTDQRLTGTLAATAISAWHGARVFRVHEVRETRQVRRHGRLHPRPAPACARRPGPGMSTSRTIVAAAVCPHPLLMFRELGGAVDPVAEARAASLAAVAAVAAAADEVVVVGATDAYLSSPQVGVEPDPLSIRRRPPAARRRRCAPARRRRRDRVGRRRRGGGCSRQVAGRARRREDGAPGDGGPLRPAGGGRADPARTTSGPRASTPRSSARSRPVTRQPWARSTWRSAAS